MACPNCGWKAHPDTSDMEMLAHLFSCRTKPRPEVTNFHIQERSAAEACLTKRHREVAESD